MIIASLGAGALTAVLLVVAFGHRSGKVSLLAHLGAFSERVSGLPGWVGVPAALAAGSLVTALMGMLWDISLHIDNGRDEGPLANPAHYLILVGLFGVFAAGVLAMAMPKEKPGPTAVRITSDWYAPLGGVLIAACGSFALIGFPLDDVWHRLFGQDVTLWGPTHLMLIGGAAMTLLGVAVLMTEGDRYNAAHGKPELNALGQFAQRAALTGGFLLGMGVFQGEFDFGVPQFRLVFHPILIMVAAGTALVAARIMLGKGAALAAVGFFLVLRGVIALLVGPVIGHSTPYFPLYVVEALVIEAVALRVAITRPVAFGAWCGIGIGTIGLAAEWGWSHLVMPIPWPSEMLPAGAILGFAAAVAASLVGAWIGARMAVQLVPRQPSLRYAAVAGAVVIAGITGYALNKPPKEGVRATVTLQEVHAAPKRTVLATVRLDPPDAAKDAVLFNTTAWQGGGLVVDPLKRVGPGTYRTPEPVPVYPDWKTLIRLQVGNSLTAIPVFLPEDAAIPAKEVPASSHFTRTFIADHKILQREQKGAAGYLWGIAYAVVIGITIVLLLLLAWAVHRVAVTGDGEAPQPVPRPASGHGGRPMPAAG